MDYDRQLAEITRDVPEPIDGESYRVYLERCSVVGPATGFGYGELVKPRRRDLRGRFREPGLDLRHFIVPTLRVASLGVRTGVVELGGHGLRVAAAFRPRGGARYSQHKRNRALDLDLLSDDTDLVVEHVGMRHRYYELLVRLWCRWGRELRMGLGLYCAPGSIMGIRGHIDIGWRCRSWQISGGHSVSLRAKKPRYRQEQAPLVIAKRLGLHPPNRAPLPWFPPML